VFAPQGHPTKYFIFLNWFRWIIFNIQFFIHAEDEFACTFLLKHGALPTVVVPDNGYSPLHLLADWKTESVAQVAEILLKQGSSPNAVAGDGRLVFDYYYKVYLEAKSTNLCNLALLFIWLCELRMST
jgi:hypothetical protein